MCLNTLDKKCASVAIFLWISHFGRTQIANVIYLMHHRAFMDSSLFFYEILNAFGTDQAHKHGSKEYLQL